MNPNRWEEIIYRVEEKFKIAKRWTEDFLVAELHDGQKILGQKEIVEFQGPLGRMRIEKISQPKIVDKKVLSSKRIGGKIVEDYIYSPDEKKEQIRVYRWNEAEQKWEEMSAMF